MDDVPIMLSRCPSFTNGDIDTDRLIPVVPKSHDCVLTDKELVDYKDRRVRFLSWLFQVGGHPESAEGYSPYTVYSTAYRTARFDLWLWDENGGYKHPPEAEDATNYVEHLAYSDKSQTAKGKAQEALQHYSKWLHHDHGHDEWVFEYSFDGSGGNHQPQDFLTREERRAIRQAALTEGNIPAYDSLTAEQRRGWRLYVSNALGIDYDDVALEDRDHVDGWEVPSLVWVSLDPGFAHTRSATRSWTGWTPRTGYCGSRRTIRRRTRGTGR